MAFTVASKYFGELYYGRNAVVSFPPQCSFVRMATQAQIIKLSVWLARFLSPAAGQMKENEADEALRCRWVKATPPVVSFFTFTSSATDCFSRYDCVN